MSDLMLLGVLRMPIPDDPNPLTLRQFVSGARQAADRIEEDKVLLQWAIDALTKSSPSSFYECKCQGSSHWGHCFWQKHQNTIEAIKNRLETT